MHCHEHQRASQGIWHDRTWHGDTPCNNVPVHAAISANDFNSRWQSVKNCRIFIRELYQFLWGKRWRSWGTAPQAGRWRVRCLVGSLGFCTMALGSTRPLTETSTRCVGWTTFPPSYADCLQILGASASGSRDSAFCVITTARPGRSRVRIHAAARYFSISETSRAAVGPKA